MNLTWKRVGLIAGPVLALITYTLLPTHYINVSHEAVDLTNAGRATLALMVWMGVWWLTEAINISATALLPIALFPLLGIATINSAAAPYAHPLIFLFMGGFTLALSMQRWGLDKRIALRTLRIVGTKPSHMVAGFMLATAVLSGFISNTATTAMMLPIALSVISLVVGDKGLNTASTNNDVSIRNFALCLMLGIAYAASIGGISTIVGTPTNAFLIGFIRDSIVEPHRQDISFLKWMMIGVPVSVLFLPIAWLVLTRILYPVQQLALESSSALLDSQYQKLGVLNRGEKVTLIVFIVTVLAWLSRPYLNKLQIDLTGQVYTPFAGLSDPGIAILAALALFVIPVDRKQHEFVMNWATFRKLPWGILILLGGGLSLASAVKHNGVAEFIGALAVHLSAMPTFVLLLAVVTAIVFLTELTSNTATAATLIPILAALAVGLSINPYLLIVPATIAASLAFMLPVATPPNAIVFGSGYVTIAQMCKAGFWLNLIGILLVMTLMYTITGAVLISS